MAILTEEGNEYEVRIVDAQTHAPFKEYIKLGDREKLGDVECERYIVAKPGAGFKIEITLKKGFCFAPFDQVEAQLLFPGQSTWCSSVVIENKDSQSRSARDPHTVYIDCVNHVIYGRKRVGAPFVFRALKADESLSNETDVMGLDPSDLGSFKLMICRRVIDTASYRKAKGQNVHSATWIAEKIDQLNFKKHGIMNTVGYHSVLLTFSTEI